MTPLALLESLESAGFTFRVTAGKLVVSPASKLTDEQRTAIVERKKELMFLTYEATEDDLACLDDSRLVDAGRWQEMPQVIAAYHFMLPKLGASESVAKNKKKRPETKTLFAVEGS